MIAEYWNRIWKLKSCYSRKSRLFEDHNKGKVQVIYKQYNCIWQAEAWAVTITKIWVLIISPKFVCDPIHCKIHECYIVPQGVKLLLKHFNTIFNVLMRSFLVFKVVRVMIVLYIFFELILKFKLLILERLFLQSQTAL